MGDIGARNVPGCLQSASCEVDRERHDDQFETPRRTPIASVDYFAIATNSQVHRLTALS